MEDRISSETKANEGTCTRCRSNPPEIGKRRCAECNQQSRQSEARRRAAGYYRSLYRIRKETGLCGFCGQKPREDDRARCSRCLEHDSLSHQVRSRNTRLVGAVGLVRLAVGPESAGPGR